MINEKPSYQMPDPNPELEQFRPRNLSQSDFWASPDLQYVAGPFSTFDVTLSRMIHDPATTRRELNHYILSTLNTVTTMAAEQVYQILIAIKDLQLTEKLTRLTMDTPTQIVQTLFQTLARKVQDRMNLSHQDLIFLVIDSWADIPADFVPSAKYRDTTFGMYVHQAYDKTDKRFHNYILMHRKNIMTHKGNLYLGTLQTFAHEFSHFVDNVEPNHGALGAQVVAWDSHAPSEFSAHTAGAVIVQYLMETQR